jgi:hypothetical protein
MPGEKTNIFFMYACVSDICDVFSDVVQKKIFVFMAPDSFPCVLRKYCADLFGNRSFECGGTYGKRNMAGRKYALSASGGDGELPETGREAEYHHGGLDWYGLQFTGDGIDLGAAGEVFLRYY